MLVVLFLSLRVTRLTFSRHVWSSVTHCVRAGVARAVLVQKE